MDIEEKQKMLKGTVLKMAINFSYQGQSDITLEEINFYTEWYCANKMLKLEKSEHVFEDGVCYAYVDTALLGTGQLRMRLWAEIPDADAPDAVRAEYAEYTTDVIIS